MCRWLTRMPSSADSAFANGNLQGGTAVNPGCVVGGSATFPDCYTVPGAQTICSGVGSNYNCYFGAASILNEHLTFPPLPNNTNGNFPSWSGVGGQFDPMWYNSQGVLLLPPACAAAAAALSTHCAHRLQLPFLWENCE
jgi:hypothetical protein